VRAGQLSVPDHVAARDECCPSGLSRAIPQRRVAHAQDVLGCRLREERAVDPLLSLVVVVQPAATSTPADDPAASDTFQIRFIDAPQDACICELNGEHWSRQRVGCCIGVSVRFQEGRKDCAVSL
jgi:hypothetical protein